MYSINMCCKLFTASPAQKILTVKWPEIPWLKVTKLVMEHEFIVRQSRYIYPPFSWNSKVWQATPTKATLLLMIYQSLMVLVVEYHRHQQHRPRHRPLVKDHLYLQVHVDVCKSRFIHFDWSSLEIAEEDQKMFRLNFDQLWHIQH